jgi:alkanesulfonate monooxygenase SsuD/methylene tetrahydromethanopterin reductase-like flavin-dependent oxidoreductase (luciferase family)
MSPVRFGLILTNQHLTGESPVERFAESVEQVRLARDLGFDLVLFGQHFLATEFLMLQPAIAAARLAAEAGAMRLGITIYLLPLLNPVAIAEETASLDIVTGGRFVFGVGLGYRAVEDSAFGLDPAERVSRLVAHVGVIKDLWAGKPVTFDAPYCRLEGATTSVRPVQKPHPPIWVAANNDRAVERIADLGDTWIINPHATLKTIARQVGLYRQALTRAGKPFPAELPMIREIALAGSREAAYRAARPHLEKKYQAYVAWGQHKVLPGDDDMTQGFDELLRDRFVVGDPAECAEQLQQALDATGATALVFRVHWPGMPHETVVRSLRLLAEQVRPRLRESSLTASR